MISFLRLEIKNLASLQGDEQHVIDFERAPLADCHIFSIVGPTGSGKSTILDAICLALYGNTPRYTLGKRQQGKIKIIGEGDEEEKRRLAPTDPRNILTNGKHNGYSKLTFATGDGKVYRAEWHVEFKRKRYGDAVRRLYLIDNGIEQEQDKELLASLLGIDFKQFLRTVIIAQGAFAELLNESEENRYQLLEKLVGNEAAYLRIGEEIAARKEAADKALADIAARCQSIEGYILTEEALASLRQEIEQLAQSEKDIEQEREAVKKTLAWYEQEHKHRQNLAAYEAGLAAAQQAVDAIKADSLLLQQHDATAQAVDIVKQGRQQHKAIADLQTQQSQQQELLTKKNDECNNATLQLASLEQAAEQAAAQATAMQPHIVAARNILAQIEVEGKQLKQLSADAKRLGEEAQKAAQALDDNRTQCAKADKDTADAQLRRDRLGTAVAARKKELADAEAEARRLLDEAGKATKGVDGEQLQQAFNGAVAATADIADALRINTTATQKESERQQLEKQLAELEKQRAALAGQLQAFNIASLEKEVDTLAQTVTLMESEKWQSHRAALAEGKPCPLCGATAHPYAAEAEYREASSQLKQLLDDKRRTLAEQRRQQQTLASQQAANESSAKAATARLKSLAAELDTLAREWQPIAGRHPEWQHDSTQLQQLQQELNNKKRQLGDELTAYTNAVKETARRQHAVDQAAEAVKQYEQLSAAELKTVEEALLQCTTRQASLKGATQGLVQQAADRQKAAADAEQARADKAKLVDEKQQAVVDEIGNRNPDELEQQLAKAREEALKAVADHKNAIAQLSAERGNIEGSLKTLSDSIATGMQTLQTLRAGLAEWLESYNSSHDGSLTVADITALCDSDTDWEQLRSRLQSLTTALTAAHTTLSNEQQAHALHQQQRPQQEEAALRQRQEELASLSQRDTLIAKQACLKQHNDAVQQLGAIADEKQRADALQKDWEAIYIAVGHREAKDLRKIAQCYTLRFLVEHANAEIRKFSDRYQLEQVRGSLALRVIDHERFDERREITSLSGGETFVVSLGLALGLASLSSGNTSFANLFIDEGFGTLDPDYLTTVIAALSAMQSQQGKKVGVISHTEGMAEGIHTRIRVVREGTGGSSHIELE